MEEKRMELPLVIDDFHEIRTGNYYYVDKTAFIQTIVSGKGKVQLYTRPRRFGKSLNLSMLKYFFSIGTDPALFTGLAVSKDTEFCQQYMGKYPVILLSLKDVAGIDFNDACQQLKNQMFYLWLNIYHELMDSDRIPAFMKQKIEEATQADAQNTGILADSLRLMTVCMERLYGRRVIVLIDEYDVPLEKAYANGYYDQMVSLLRGFFSSALKSNPSLQTAVLTGCLRISKESIFTGLNNMTVYTIHDAVADEYFGFTEEETEKMLEYYGLKAYQNTVREWYDGYLFGNTSVYCPWDVIQYCAAAVNSGSTKPENYWINTSGNDILRKLIETVNAEGTLEDIEKLIAGETVKKNVQMNLTYRDLDETPENIWSLLYTTGYLTKAADEKSADRMCLKIPNREVRETFVQQAGEWFREGKARRTEDLKMLYHGVECGNASELQTAFSDFLSRTIGVRDWNSHTGLRENFYHGVMLGLLENGAWDISSNREAGEGYSDIWVRDRNYRFGAVMELKYIQSENPAEETLERAADQALEQIEKKDYTAGLRKDNVPVIHEFGIVCYRRQCFVKVKAA